MTSLHDILYMTSLHGILYMTSLHDILYMTSFFRFHSLFNWGRSDPSGIT